REDPRRKNGTVLSGGRGITADAAFRRATGARRAVTAACWSRRRRRFLAGTQRFLGRRQSAAEEKVRGRAPMTFAGDQDRTDEPPRVVAQGGGGVFPRPLKRGARYWILITLAALLGAYLA